MSLRARVLLAYLAILAAGASLSTLVFVNGQAIVSDFTPLVREELPLAQTLSRLEAANGAVAEILYAYYATQDRPAFVRTFAANEIERRRALSLVANQAGREEELLIIQDAFSDIEKHADDLDDVLSVYGRQPVDWDLARTLLEDAAARAAQATLAIERLGETARSEILASAQQLERRTRFTMWVVLGVIAAFLIGAAFAAFAVHRFLREATLRRKLALFVERNPGAVIRLGAEGSIEFANPSAGGLLSQLGIAPGKYASLLPSELAAGMRAARESPGSLVRLEHEVSGAILGIALHHVAEFDVYHAYVNDMTAERLAERRVDFLAHHDELTGLPNRRVLETDLRTRSATPAGHAATTLLLADIDRLRAIVQMFGNDAADTVLTEFTSRAREACGGRPDFYRLDAGAFAVVVDSGTTDIAELASWLQTRADTPVQWQSQDVHFTVSLGIADGTTAVDAPQLLRQAAAALAEAKREGPRSLRRYDSDLQRAAEDRLTLLDGLRHAIQRDELSLQYQPKVDAATDRVNGVEALLRWRHPIRGPISPALFIPLAESSLQILPIGQWVMETAARQARDWAERGLGGLRVAINVSTRQFAQPDFLQTVEAILQRTGVDPAQLEFEVTESLAMQDIDATVMSLRALSELGIHVAIDDFGTGFSSLSYLQRLPIHTLKLDRAFVKGLPDSIGDRVIAQSVLDLARGLELSVVAEGVEDGRQVEWLREKGCHSFQGFHFARPMDAALVPGFVAARAEAALLSLAAAQTEDHLWSGDNTRTSSAA